MYLPDLPYKYRVDGALTIFLSEKNSQKLQNVFGVIQPFSKTTDLDPKKEVIYSKYITVYSSLFDLFNKDDHKINLIFTAIMEHGGVNINTESLGWKGFTQLVRNVDYFDRF